MTQRGAAENIGPELGAARRAAGLSQRAVASRAGLSQSTLSRIERGAVVPTLGVARRVATVVGHRLYVRLFPADGVGLRDSGQMHVATQIQAAINANWNVRLEVPVADYPDRRAADMTLARLDSTVLVEIERGPYDFQAQLRAAQLKRTALAERLGRSVRLVVAVPDTPSARRRLRPFAGLLAASLPIPSRSVWACLRIGSDTNGDGLLWVRVSRSPPGDPDSA